MGAKEVVTAIVEPATKLIECVSGAIGKAYEPRHIRKMADAKAYELQTLSEAIRNNSDLPIVFNGETAIDISDFEALIKRAGYRLGYQEIAKQENIESIVDQAYDELEGKELLSDESVSRDWMNRYIDAAGDISSSEMQSIWAKVLAGEVIEPNSFSLQTLDCLKNLSSKDAALFSKICPYVFSGIELIRDAKILEKYGIIYNDILHLDDCGLINALGDVSKSIEVSSDPKILYDFGEYVLVVKAKREEKFTINVHLFPLTRAGRELYSIAYDGNRDVNYFKDVMKYAENHYSNCVFELHKVYDRAGNQIRFHSAITVFGDME